MERDNFKCVECGTDEKELQVHHEKYISGNEPWEYPDELLITLCCDCHKAKHKPEPPTLSENIQVVSMTNQVEPLILEFYWGAVDKIELFERINELNGSKHIILKAIALALKSETLREESHLDAAFYIKKFMELNEVKIRFVKEHKLNSVIV